MPDECWIGGHPFHIACCYILALPSTLVSAACQVNPATIPGFDGAEAICNPVTTGSQINAGSDALQFDGAIAQLGAISVIQEPPPCPIPAGFSPGAAASLGLLEACLGMLHHQWGMYIREQN